jgi:small subunit ribosomal protein S4
MGTYAARRGREKDYAIRLRAKQRAKRIYGILEAQFRRYFEEAARQKGVTGEVLAQLLERRLDNVVYRLGFGVSRRMARQLVLHRHVLVNGRPVNIPSYRVKEGDVIELREKSRQIPGVVESVEAAHARGIPPWLELDVEHYRGRVKALPTLADADPHLDVQMIVEFYSR